MPNQTTLFNYRWIIVPWKYLANDISLLGPCGWGQVSSEGLNSAWPAVSCCPSCPRGLCKSGLFCRTCWLEVEAAFKQATLVWLSALLARQLGLGVQAGDVPFARRLEPACEREHALICSFTQDRGWPLSATRGWCEAAAALSLLKLAL